MMKSFIFSIFILYIYFSNGAFKGRKFIILIAFSWYFFNVLNSSFWSYPHHDVPISHNFILKRVLNKYFGVKCLIFARGLIPRLTFLFSSFGYISQSNCSFSLRPNYMTCIFRGINFPLILKFRCFVMFLLDLGLNSKISVLLIFKDILFAISHVLRSFKSWLVCFLSFWSVI